MNEKKRIELLTKLANLLDEYNVNIWFVCSRILDTFNEWYLSSNVIKENM